MDEPVVSEFSTFYYLRSFAIAVAVVVGWIGVLSILTAGSLADIDFFTVLLGIILLVVTYYYLTDNFMVISVGHDRILIKYSITNKQKVVEYANIVAVNTYRSRRDPGLAAGFHAQSFLIELNTGSPIRFASGDYNNYDALKAAIYKYKLGIG